MDTYKDSTEKTVTELAHEELMRQIPLMVFLTVLCLCGIVGNSLVCYIFTKKYPKSTFRIFVTVLAAVDWFTCSVVLPLELVQFAWQYTYDSVVICKLNLFVKMWTTITSGFLFLCIAVDRYKRVCRPFSVQISLRGAKTMCIGSAVLAVAFSWESLVMYSTQNKNLKVYNLTVSECAITKAMKKTAFPLITNILLTILFIGSLSGIIIMYSFIVVRVRQQLKKKIGKMRSFKQGKQSRDKEGVSHSTTNDEKSDDRAIERETSSNPNDLYSVDVNDCEETIQETEMEDTVEDKSATESDPKRTRSRKKTRSSYKTTIIMLIITLAFIISYSPLLCVSLISLANRAYVRSLTDTGRAVYKFVHRSYFINSAINPVIYGVWDSRFRKSCKTLIACRQK